MSLHVLSQLFPVVAICVRLLAPQIKLELTLRKRAALEAFVWTLLSGKFHGRLHSSMIDCLEDLRVEIECFRALKSKTNLLEGVRHPLYPNTYGAMAEVRRLCLLDGVVVAIDDSVQVPGDSLGYAMQGLKVKGATLVVCELGKRNRGEIANGYLFFAGVLEDLSAEVRALDGAEVLLVGFAVAVILVEHVRGSCLDLRVDDLTPEPLGLHCLLASFLFFVLEI